MVCYRIYHIGAGEGLWRVEDIRCADDAAAIAAAEARRGPHKIQLWKGKELLRRFEPLDPPA